MISFALAGEAPIHNPPRISLRTNIRTTHCSVLVEIKTMTAKVIRIPEFREREAEDTSAEPSAVEATGTGWDPYEVWRTRVLQPRLDDSRGNESPEERPRRKRSFFDWFRRFKSE